MISKYTIKIKNSNFDQDYVSQLVKLMGHLEIYKIILEAKAIDGSDIGYVKLVHDLRINSLENLINDIINDPKYKNISVKLTINTTALTASSLIKIFLNLNLKNMMLVENQKRLLK